MFAISQSVIKKRAKAAAPKSAQIGKLLVVVVVVPVSVVLPSLAVAPVVSLVDGKGVQLLPLLAVPGGAVAP